MQREGPPNTESKFATSLAIALVFIALASLSCSTSRHHHASDAIYWGSDEPRKPGDEFATVVTDYPRVLRIDGMEINKPQYSYDKGEATYPDVNYSRAELRPGRHTFLVYIYAWPSPIVAIIEATLDSGHTYLFQEGKHYRRTYGVSNYAVMMIDATTSVMVGGRTEDANDWSWEDFIHSLDDMKKKRASRVTVMEQFGVPATELPDEMLKYSWMKSMWDIDFPKNTLVYAPCEYLGSLRTGGVSISNTASAITVDGAGKADTVCRYLVVVFNESNEFQDYYLVNVPFHKCYSPPSIAWDWRGKMIRSLSCKYYLHALGIVEYYAVSGNPQEAYHVLELSVLNSHMEIERFTKSVIGTMNPEKLQKSVDQITEDLISDGRSLIKRYPDMLVAAQNSFTASAFAMSVKEHGDEAVTIERERLAVFGRLAGTKQSEIAKHEFSKFFGI